MPRRRQPSKATGRTTARARAPPRDLLLTASLPSLARSRAPTYTGSKLCEPSPLHTQIHTYTNSYSPHAKTKYFPTHTRTHRLEILCASAAPTEHSDGEDNSTSARATPAPSPDGEHALSLSRPQSRATPTSPLRAGAQSGGGGGSLSPDARQKLSAGSGAHSSAPVHKDSKGGDAPTQRAHTKAGAGAEGNKGAKVSSLSDAHPSAPRESKGEDAHAHRAHTKAGTKEDKQGAKAIAPSKAPPSTTTKESRAGEGPSSAPARRESKGGDGHTQHTQRTPTKAGAESRQGEKANAQQQRAQHSSLSAHTTSGDSRPGEEEKANSSGGSAQIKPGLKQPTSLPPAKETVAVAGKNGEVGAASHTDGMAEKEKGREKHTRTHTSAPKPPPPPPDDNNIKALESSRATQQTPSKAARVAESSPRGGM